ncbi:FG-GAP repeat protein [candidate division KSB1 bacterium]|nr:FG-GAP repeat protein [candidate division KSB1 bacterium]
MKRVGYILMALVAVLVIFTLALAQLEGKNAKNLLRVISGEQTRAYFGSGVEGAYAWTGGAKLYAISATGENDGPVRRGYVNLYDNLLADAPVLTIQGGVEGELFGSSLSGGGDFNGDGMPDLAVAADGGQGTGQKPAGKVYLYFGGPDFGRSASAVLTMGESKDSFGQSVSLKDDINGDGLADLIVGAPHSAKSGATSGRAYIWFGRSGSVSKSPDKEIRLGTMNDLFGTSVSTGDLNGDGTADLVIGAPHFGTEADYFGAAFIFFGGKDAKFSSASQILKGEKSSFQDQFGWSVAVVPDIDGDGKAELVVGAPQCSQGGRQLGKVYLYHGAEKLSDVPSATFWGSVEAGKFGQHVFSLGDINGDKKGDWAAQADQESGSRGTVHFFYGGWDKEFYKYTGEAVADRLGSCLVNIGDFDGNGSSEILSGARWNDTESENSGRCYILSLE